MNTIMLNNDIQMPMLGFGTFLMGGLECEESVLTALRSGYRMIDTAEAYGNEEAVGNAIVKSGIAREELFIVTKVNFRSYENTRETVEMSLKRLKTSYLDLVLLHWPFGNYYAAWRELENLYQEGKIRAIGVSNFDPDRLIDLIEFNKVTPAVNQIETHLLCQRMAEHEWLEKYHVQHMAYAPLGQGRKNEMFENPVLIEIAKIHGKTASQIALRFLMQSGVIVIPKSIHEERIKENFDLFDFELNTDEMEQLKKMDMAAPMIGNPENPSMVESAMKWKRRKCFMKNILLLGATGTAGSAITQKLLSDTDYHVTLFARHAGDKFSDSPRTTVVNGDAENVENLKKAMQGQDVVYCAISGEALPQIAENIVAAMGEYGVKRLIFMGAVGIYNEIPDEIDGEDNLDNEPAQLPNRQAVDIVETSNLNYTVLRPGYLKEGEENDFVLSVKGEPAKGYITTIPSLVKLAVQLISDENLYSMESVSITKDARIDTNKLRPIAVDQSNFYWALNKEIGEVYQAGRD